MALTDVKSEQIQSSVALAGSPTTTTQSASDNSTKIATTAYVETAVANLVASAPSALNTLDELAAALNDDASFSTTVTNNLAGKVALSGSAQTIADSGNFTIDAAGEINLDADGGKVRFKDGGTEHIRFVMDNSGVVQLYSAVQDVDIKIQGNDGGSVVDALTFDMSDGGTAIFGSWQKMADNNRIVFGAGSDLAIYSDGTNGNILASGELIIDVDTQGSGNGILLKDAGTLYGSIYRSSSNLHIKAEASDQDLLFMGNDGGTEITALTLDMSASGRAEFNAGANFNDAIDISAGTNLNLGVRPLSFNNFSNEGVGITFSRTSSDADLMAIGVVDTSKLNFASRSGLIFSTGGGSTYAATSEVMRIDSSGYVGIGTSNIDARLHIEGNSDNGDADVELVIEDLDSSSGSQVPSIIFKGNGSLIGRIRANDVQGMLLSGGSVTSDDLVVTNSGVGINTNSPSARLHVVDESAEYDDFRNVIRIESQSTNTTTTGFGGAIYWLGERNGDGALQAMCRIRSNAEVNSGTTLSSGLVFETATAGVPSEKMRISHQGYVTTPKQPSAVRRITGGGLAGVNCNGQYYQLYFGVNWRDEGSMHSQISGGGSKFTAPVAGVYFYSCQIRVDAFSGSYFYIDARVNGTTRNRDLSSNTGNYLSYHVVGTYYLGVGDYFTFEVANSNDNSVNIDDASYVSVYLVG